MTEIAGEIEPNHGAAVSHGFHRQYLAHRFVADKEPLEIIADASSPDKAVADRHVVVENGGVVDILSNAELEADMGRVKSYLGV